MTAAPTRTLEEVTRNVHVIRTHIKATPGWEQWYLLRSDAHHDNPKNDEKLERQHLEEAKARGAGILDFGDLFCAMQGKWDKRASQSELKPEHRGDDYLNRLVDTAVEFYQPYAKNFLILGSGNHETAILKHHGYNLTQALADRLQAKGSPLKQGGYSGWVRFSFTRGNERMSRVLYYHHGYGGDAPVTRGTIQTARMGLYLPDADIVITGHNHHDYLMPISRLRISQGNKLTKDEQVHVKTPGYKDDFDDGHQGWHIERGGPPKPLGAAWLKFYWKSERLQFDVVRAK